jgi:hypothetical protein
VSFIPCSEIGFYVNYTILKEEMLGWLEIIRFFLKVKG